MVQHVTSVTSVAQVWGKHQLLEKETGFWKIGPMRLWILRHSNEWGMHSLNSRDSQDRDMAIQVPFHGDLPERAQQIRYGVTQTGPELYFSPCLADRSMVLRPESPFIIPPGQKVALYISTSLWIQISFSHQKIALTTLPVFRTSDTWFGPSTIEGEFCYLSRTSARLRYEDLIKSPYRAVTQVYLHNSSDGPLTLERFKLPVGNLRLYRSPASGLFFTDGLEIEFLARNKEINFEVLAPFNPDGVDLELMAPAQLGGDRNIVFKAIGHLFD
jgi:hypothetical protein